MATLNKFYSFVEALAEKKHNLGSDTIKAMLSNTAPSLSNTVKADITEISATSNGYTAGGSALTVTSSSQTSGVYKLVANDVTFTQSGASDLGPFRYVILYNDTATNDELIGYYDLESEIVLNGSSGATFSLDFDATDGVLSMT